MTESYHPFDVVRIERQAGTRAVDQIAVEAALEVKLEGQPFSVIMRTPGADEDLAAGFLFAEGVIRSADDIRRIELLEPAGVNVRLSRERAEILPELLGERRQVVVNASCGMCGRRTLASLSVDRGPLDVGWAVPEELVLRLPAMLRAVQSTFSATGGLHAAGLFDVDGVLELSAEDVGRHNAVDKLIGHMVRRRRLLMDRKLLFVSGRTSFEIVQKALLARIPFLAAVSAPSSLAIELARDAGMTLLGFVREGRFNIYSHAERVQIANASATIR